jgi:hypothetical protein
MAILVLLLVALCAKDLWILCKAIVGLKQLKPIING